MQPNSPVAFLGVFLIAFVALVAVLGTLVAQITQVITP